MAVAKNYELSDAQWTENKDVLLKDNGKKIEAAFKKICKPLDDMFQKL